MIAFDAVTDVVSAYVAETTARRARPAPHDAHLLLEFDAADNVVGLELEGASTLAPAFWRAHPDRPTLPLELLGELDRWLAGRWAALEGR